MQLKQQPQTNQLPINHTPAHVAVIMDRNGRWAQLRGLPRLAGYRAGTENIRRVHRCLSLQGVRFLSLYAGSSEN